MPWSAAILASVSLVKGHVAAITAFKWHGGLGAEPPESQGVWGAQPPRMEGVWGAPLPRMQGVRGAQPPGIAGGRSPPAKRN